MKATFSCISETLSKLRIPSHFTCLNSSLNCVVHYGIRCLSCGRSVGSDGSGGLSCRFERRSCAYCSPQRKVVFDLCPAQRQWIRYGDAQKSRCHFQDCTFLFAGVALVFKKRASLLSRVLCVNPVNSVSVQMSLSMVLNGAWNFMAFISTKAKRQ